jgi:hypothetical protein
LVLQLKINYVKLIQVILFYTVKWLHVGDVKSVLSSWFDGNN